MQREDFELEELLIPEPIRLPLHRFDLVVCAFQRGSGSPQ
jgi:hypothetical protein